MLVHCQAGISRSATICLAYLINARRVSLDEAFDFVKRRRQVISPNLAFMGQLLQFETDILCPYSVLDRKNGGTAFWTLMSWTVSTYFQKTDLLATALTSKTVKDLQRCFQEGLVWCYLWVYKRKTLKTLNKGTKWGIVPFKLPKLVWVIDGISWLPVLDCLWQYKLNIEEWLSVFPNNNGIADTPLHPEALMENVIITCYCDIVLLWSYNIDPR